MYRFVPYLGIVAALATGIFIAVSFNDAKVAHAPVVITVPNIPPKILVVNSPATTTPEKSNPQKRANTPPANTLPTVPTPHIAPPLTVATLPEVNQELLDTSASALRGALVNIVCYVPAGSNLHSISASGVIIDPKGIILTNAHAAQYFLLADRSVSCVIRSGSPAVEKYNAKLIYISPEWLRANPNVLTKTNPAGTGQYDFALLAITKSTTRYVLPSSFPYVSLATMPPVVGDPIIIASYGAQFLESSQISSNLFPTVVFGSIKDVFTFGTNTIDVLALGGSVAAQEGSSGGGVADSSGELIGTITTSTITGSTDTRSLDAITASYIRAEYASETGQPLDFLLSEPTSTSVANFTPQIPALEKIITANLP